MDCTKKTHDFIPVLGMPTSVVKYGNVDSNTSAVFIVIPGNPGVIEYYEHFMSSLYERTDKRVPVWGVSHAGHVKPPAGNKKLYDHVASELCTLDGQIRHKIDFIEENVPKHVKLFLIGHSIGCYIILKIIDQLNHTVQRCFQLFPTVERMAVSPNGRIFTPTLKYFRWAGVVASFWLSFLPDSIKYKLIKWHFGSNNIPACAYSATTNLIHPFSVGNSLFMANQEMKMVDELDTELIGNNLDRLSFYFGQTDKWCPQEYYHDMRAKFPEGDFRLCENGYSHAFVLDASREMADIVWEWVKPYL